MAAARKKVEKEEAPPPPDPRVELWNSIANLPEDGADNSAKIKAIKEAIANSRTTGTEAQMLLVACQRHPVCADNLTYYAERQSLATLMSTIFARYNDLGKTTDGRQAIANAYYVATNQ